MIRGIDRDAIVRMYGDGLSTKQIGSHVGLSHGAVRSVLKSRGVKMRSICDSLKARYPDGRLGDQAANWKGGRRRGGTKMAYIMLLVPNHPHCDNSGYVMEHRVIAEKLIGRYLTRGEVVHHKNGIKTDNRPENLEVMTITQHRKEHMDAHSKLHEARQEIERLKALLAQQS